MRVFGSWPTWDIAEPDLTKLDPPVDVQALRDAHIFAARWHGDQRRPAGEPYVQHLLEAMEITATYAGVRRQDQLIAALLHDVVEDTGCTLTEVQTEFGGDVSVLVDWLTKKDPTPGQTSDDAREQYLDSLASAPDEVLTVKLADRYSNVQRLHTHPRPEKQRTYYSETCQVFLPLSKRVAAFEPLFDEWQQHYRYLGQ